MNILMIGDVFGEPGKQVLQKTLKKIREDESIDFVVVNGENTTNGRSVSYNDYLFYKKCGVDVITGGNHIFDHPDTLEYINKHHDLIKPINMYQTPGKGYFIKEVNGVKICVVNVLGVAFMDPSNSFYEKMDEFLNLKLDFDILLVDFHAEAAYEKISFALNYDGIITAFVGTHTHVTTADERILPKGTAYITDIGMSGVIDSVLGSKFDGVVPQAKMGFARKFEPADGEGTLNGVVVRINPITFKAESIKRITAK